jgi:hypothetical protein
VRRTYEIISQKSWSALISTYSVKDICSYVSFSEAMHLVKHLCYDDLQDDEKQQYALKLAFEIKNHFKKEWESDWKNEVFLGGLCEMVWLYDERYFCYKRAYDKLNDPPAELLFLLSDCDSAPGTPPITHQEADLYLKKSIEKKVTSESAFTMKNIYRLKEDKLQEEYWDRVYRKLENENVHFDQLIPDVLKTPPTYQEKHG